MKYFHMQVPTDSTYSANTEKISLPDVTNKTVEKLKDIRGGWLYSKDRRRK